VFEELLDNAGRLRLVEQAGTTFYHGVPSVVHFLTDELEASDYDLSRVRRVGYGGSAMPPELVIRIEKAWAPAIQIQIYGLTESGPTGLVMPPEYLHEKMGAVGRAMPFTEIRIEDPEGRPLGSGQFGEIVVESPGVAVGYYRNPEASAAVFKGRSVRSGDGGIMDEDGFVRFTDRIKDMINRGGLKISSVAVEAVLYEHPNVKEAAAIAVHHPALGEDVAACVVPQNGARLSPAELSAFCKDKLADYEQPRHWFILDELVKNPMGKILKRELRAYVEEQLSRRNGAEAIRN
jgi:acyl-CoA synthetase (AMP-forming)/AMP-acid ligase II